MRKKISLVLAAVMVFSLTACGTNNQPAESAAATEAATTESTEAGAAEDETAAAETEAVETEATSGEEAETSDTIMVSTLNANGEKTEVEVPYDAKRLAVMDLATLDILDNIGVGDRVVGVSKGSSIDYLQDYVTDDSIENLGTIKEADMEAVMACEPDIIFIGGRLSSYYDELSEIAPVIYLASDTEVGVVQSTSDNAMNIASIFGLEDTISGLMADYDARITALAENAEGKTAVVGMVNAGGFNVLGNDGRCSIIGVEVGYENIGLEAASSSGRGQGGSGRGESESGSEAGTEAETKGGEESTESSSEAASGGATTATHGNEASFEVLVSLNPDYIFIMDRDAAIGTEGAQLAKEVMENEIVMMTDAYQNGNIVYLEHSNVWYTAEGGITALGIMLDDLESALQ